VDKTESPMISVIVPCYNHAKYLPQTLHSVLMQSYNNWECIIVNDGSTDNTEEVASEWVKKDMRFKYIKKINGGLSSARNEGLNVIIGKYVQFLDADDLIENEKLKLSLEVIGKASPTLVISDFMVFDEISSKLLPPWCDLGKININFATILLEWDITFTIPIHCGLFPAFYFNRIRFDETLGAKEDWLIWLSIFKEFQPNILYINKSLVVYRYCPLSMTKNYAFMHANINKAFYKIYNEFVNETYADDYFRKVNNYWYQELKNAEKRNQMILQSRIFRFSAAIAKPIRYITELFKLLKHSK